jgi:beta-galactosidase/beta-glucuronidase
MIRRYLRSTVFLISMGFSLITQAHAHINSESEFPQPQFARANWQSLNGPWQFAFDDKNIGLNQHWQQNGLPSPRAIQVPFTFESALSGIKDTSEHGFSWYEKTFSLPSTWKAKAVLLHFGAVHYKATVWLNGQLLGTHTGGQTPFEFELTKLNSARAGSNTLVVRCEHPPTDPYIARGKQATTPIPDSVFYTRTSGIWQSVWLEEVGTNSLSGAHFETDLQGNGSALIQLRHPSEQQNIRITVIEPSGNKWHKIQAIPENATEAKIDFKIAHPALWSPSHPQLYEVEMELLENNGSLADQVSSYFGIREIKLENGKLFLNGESLYLKFVLDQGFWPDGIWATPSTADLLKDIQLTQAMGFNGVRKHQKIEDPRFLYLADHMGLLVSGEFASPFKFSQSSWQQFSREWTEAVTRDWNHPSIIIWAPANESWGYPNLASPQQQKALRALYTQTKSLDSSRLAIDNEGWQHSDLTDLFALHDYAKDGPTLVNEFSHFNPNAQPPIQIPNIPGALIPGFSYNKSPLYLSEFAGIGFILPGDNVASNAWGYQGLEPSGVAALGRLQSLYSGLTQLHNLIGICITQLTDVEQEVNGLLTYHRQPKYDLSEIKKLNDSLQP